MAVSPTPRGISRQRATTSSRKQRSKRMFALEMLETRALLSYTFSYSNPNDVTVNETGGNDSFTVIDSAGVLQYSINGGAFSPDWGGPGNVVDPSSTTTVTINLGADGSAINLGNATSAASNNLATFDLTPAAGNTSDSLTIDDSARGLSGGTYTVGSSPGLIVGPATGVDVQESTNLFGGGTTIDGNGAGNTLNYVANGVTPTVTSSGLGSVTIGSSNFGNLTADSFDSINLTNFMVPTISPGPSVPPDTNGGLIYTNTIVGTFTLPLGTIITTPSGVPASDFTASINWGDGSTTTGTVVQDTSNPSVYDIIGSHTYSAPGTYTVGNTVAFSGATISANVGGSAVSVILPPISATAGNSTTINTDPLTAIAGFELRSSTGVLFTYSAVGSFTDANTSEPASDFTAVIDWGDGSATSLGTVVAAGGGTFNVEGTHAYSKPGTFATTVDVTGVNGSTVTIKGSALASDLDLTGDGSSFSATEGINTGTIVLGTFTDPNPLATVADVSATIPADGWGDGTPSSAQSLAVREIGATSAGTIFQVLGAHTYAEAGSYTVNIDASTLGSGPTALTPATATVADAPLAGSKGITFTGTEGIATPATTLIGAFIDANPSATVADFTTGTGSVVVNWGDGSPLQTLTGANLTVNNSVQNSVFSIDASHTYAEEGEHAVIIDVTDADGATTFIASTAIIADAPLTPLGAQPPVTQVQPTSFPVPQFGTPAFGGPVAIFIDAARAYGSDADFTATIDWGDGTAPSAGTVEAGPVGYPAGAYVVSGTHTYAQAGTYPIQVFVVDTGGSRLTVDNTATVTALPLSVSGTLAPASDSGLSTGNADVTNVVQPTFTGTVVSTLPSGATVPEALARVSLTTVINGVTTLIGTGTTNSLGAWSITSTVALPDGTYAISATATDEFGGLATTSVIVPSLLIDTTGPVISGMFFNHFNGQVDFTIQDPNPASGPPSGVFVSSLLDSSNYLLTKVHPNKDYPGQFIVTNVTATPGASPGSYDVAVTLNNGQPIKGGFYLFTIRGSSNGNSSVQDIAENHLDGVFYGSFPSGNGIPGSDFVAELVAYHDKVFAPQTIEGTASAANGGVGGVPVGFVHSGLFVPGVPVGGQPIFSTTLPSRAPAPYPKGPKVTTNAKAHSTETAEKAHATAKPVKAHEVKAPAVSHPQKPKHSTPKKK
jgi:hypothetical protein